MKLLFLIFTVALIMFFVKPTKTVREITGATKIYCKDVCKK